MPYLREVSHTPQRKPAVLEDNQIGVPIRRSLLKRSKYDAAFQPSFSQEASEGVRWPLTGTSHEICLRTGPAVTCHCPSPCFLDAIKQSLKERVSKHSAKEIEPLAISPTPCHVDLRMCPTCAGACSMDVSTTLLSPTRAHAPHGHAHPHPFVLTPTHTQLHTHTHTRLHTQSSRN